MADDLSRLQKLTERLYSRSAIKRGVRRHDFPERENIDVLTKWQELPEEPEVDMSQSPKQKKGPWIFLFCALIFFVGTVVFGYYSLTGDRQSVSTDRVSIALTGPVEAPAGEALPFEITLQNNNPTELNRAILNIEYPAGTRNADDVTKELTREKIELGTLAIGSPINKKLSAVLFGETGQTKRIGVSLDYRVAGSNSTFTAKNHYDVVISSSPVSLDIEGVKEINSGQTTTLTVSVRSNASAPMKNMLLRAQFPFGFTFVSSDLAPIEPGVWALGNMFPGETRVVKIKGRLEGQNDEERFFQFTTGLASQTDTHRIGVGFLSASHSIVLARPFLGLKIVLDSTNQNGDVVVRPKEKVTGTIEWVNNTQSDLRNVVITLGFLGPLYVSNSVTAPNGTYRISEKNIVWNSRTEESLQKISPGTLGSFRFSFEVPEMISVSSSKDAVMTLSASGKADRSGESDVPESVESLATQRVRLAGNIALTSRALYGVGGIQNSGPLPPKVDTKTTYTIGWSLTNGINQMGNVVVQSKLPPHVKWLENFVPTGERLYYNEDTNTLTWEAGTVRPFVGGKGGSKEVFFQVELSPTLDDVGSAPDLLGQAELSATDAITGEKISARSPSLTTYIFTDPIYKAGMDAVVE